jgi:16S rRNA (guanine966-N2)-methyltransferase
MIKITGGELRGRSIKCKSGLGTRPSGAKVREAIFNILGSKVSETKWLDLFGGTGAIGIEAISRGAESSFFTEKDFMAFKLLKENLSDLKIDDKTKVFKTEAISFLKNTQESFDFIYIDPPYASEYYNQALKIFEEKPSILKENGLIIMEHNSKFKLPETSINKIKTYKYGDTSITLYSYDN